MTGRLARVAAAVVVGASAVASVPAVAGAAVGVDAVDDQYATDAETALTVSAAEGVLSNDVTPAGGSVRALDGPSNGTLDLQPDGSFTYVPEPGFAGTDTFTYELTGPRGETALTLLADLAPGSASSQVFAAAPFGAHVYFVRSVFSSPHGQYAHELWRTDGTPSGTILFADLNAGGAVFHPGLSELCPAGDLLYFRGADIDHGVELWRTDGTTEGTVRVADLAPGPASSNPESGCTTDGTSLWFQAGVSSTSTRIFSTTGTGVTDVIGSDVGPTGGFALLDGSVIHQDTGGEPAIDGVRLADLHPTARSFASWFTTTGEHVVFTASVPVDPSNPSGAQRTELFTTGGVVDDVSSLTVLSTTSSKVVGVQGGAFADAPFGYTDGTSWTPLPGALTDAASVGPFLVYRHNDGTSGREPWISDGTSAGTGLLADINPGPGGSDPARLSAVGDAVYFMAEADGSQAMVWRSDLTTAGTEAVPGAAAITNAQIFAPLGPDGLFFYATDGATGFEPWFLGPTPGESDTATVTIAVDGTKPVIHLTITELVEVHDGSTLGASIHLTITETVAVNDETAAAPSIHLTITETVAVQDGTVLAPSIRISIREAVTVSDGLTASTTTPTSSSARLTFDGFEVDAVAAGVDLRFSAEGFAPGGAVIVELRSAPVLLTTTTADGHGGVDLVVRIPPDATTGAHQLVASGPNLVGGVHEASVALFVTDEPPKIHAVGSVGGEIERFSVQIHLRRGELVGKVFFDLGDFTIVVDSVLWVAVHDGVAVIHGSGIDRAGTPHRFTLVLDARNGDRIGLALTDPLGVEIARIPLGALTRGRIALG